MSAGSHETEVKIAVADLDQVRRRLLELGFAESQPRAFEANTLYDTPEQSLRQNMALLRVREVGNDGRLTWKGPPVAGAHKSRPELETGISAPPTLGEILERLGFAPQFRYEKFRSELRHPAQPDCVATLDETPIGNFIELEGMPDWIDQTARQLGFSGQDYVLDSYGHLYLEHCRKNGLQPAHMVFTSPETSDSARHGSA